ncbi:MAG TPA: helix-turn-helix transcriptional regulator [Streptosporangiaceae bacterium]|nr:helix-turn-helix transcriptional regulator [Streptosporangiaceae bacterium]
MSTSLEDRGELGDFLRSRRERLTPAALGLPGGRRRRTPGLRREEVAELAGIGVDWYVRLEQGRSVRPSVATIDALALALRLDPAERTHLRALARSPRHHAFTRETVPAPIRRLVEGLNQPAYITGRRRDVLAWNAAACVVITDFRQSSDEDRNVLIWMLTTPEARHRFGPGWSGEAQRMVAQFRATHDLWARDPAFESLMTRLRDGSPEFVTWWDTHDIRRSQAGHKTFHYPDRPGRAPLRFEYTTFQANDDPALKLSIYTPA